MAIKPHPLNILINRVVDDQHNPTGRNFTGISVVVRDGYSGIAENDPRAFCRRQFVPIHCTTKFDPDEINNLGQRGASVVDLDPARVERVVAELLAEWGPLPVQDNSGRFPHLATAPGVLRI